ncbi:MAG: hypothetical protein JOZ25_02950 [Actinobacteria bacterium]|nr:hypothetical protein [Actinomycetota bacterium]
MKRKALTLACVAVVAVAAGCGSSKKSTSSTQSTPSTTSTTSAMTHVGAPGASVKFVTPKPGSTTGSKVTVKVKVKNFKLAPQAVGKPAKQGEGHLHFSLDGGRFDQPKYSGANGKLAVKLGVNGKYSPAVMPTITYMGLAKGKHTIVVYLANNDHSNTGVEASETFTVQ